MGSRIFIVEDEQIIAADLEAKLARLGHEVIGMAASGEEAIHQVVSLQPHLVLMDIRIQGKMDGIEAAHRIQALTGTPIIFTTAYGEMFLTSPSVMVSPALCLSKPFSLYQLRTVLDTVLQNNA